MTEMKALGQLKKGSEEALGWFVDQYSGYVTTIVYHIIGPYMDVSDIEEVASDVFFALWQNARKVRPGKVKGYLGAIARNMAKNKLRSKGMELSLEEQILLSDAVTPEALIQKTELEQAVRFAVESMKEPEREIFLRHYYYGQKTELIAGEMNLNHSTVRSKLHRGRESLRKTLDAYLS